MLCLQSSTEVSALADDYSSTVSVSDKVVPSGDSTAAGKKVSSGDNPQPGSWRRTEVEAVGGRSLNPSKAPHLLSDVDSEGT